MRHASGSHQVKPDQYLVNQHGKPQAVVLSIVDFQKMIRHIEDLEDAVSLKHAIKTSRQTISHAQLMERLKSRKLI